jgi:hypothetical protein
VMDRWAKLCGRYMGTHRGFSIGISDVAPSDRLTEMKHDILLEGYKKVCTQNFFIMRACYVQVFLISQLWSIVLIG